MSAVCLRLSLRTLTKIGLEFNKERTNKFQL